MTMKDTKNNSVQLSLGSRRPGDDLVRFSYLHAFKAVPKKDAATDQFVQDENGDKIYEFSVQVHIPKTAKLTLKEVNAAIEAAGKDFFGDKWEATKKHPQVKLALRDGDVEAELKEQPELMGHFFVNARSTKKPRVVGARKDPETGKFIDLEPGDVKSGDYGRVGVAFYGFKKGGGFGVACALNNIQYLKEGVALGGGRAAEDDFDEEDLDDESNGSIL